jgi:hypothetical protein
MFLFGAALFFFSSCRPFRYIASRCLKRAWFRPFYLSEETQTSLQREGNNLGRLTCGTRGRCNAVVQTNLYLCRTRLPCIAVTLARGDLAPERGHDAYFFRFTVPSPAASCRGMMLIMNHHEQVTRLISKNRRC